MTAASEPPRPPFVVLVAEDDVLIRMMAVDALTDAGFVVIEAVQADEALGLLIAQAVVIHALFTDIQMPGAMTGLELAHHVRDQFPRIALLVASGNSRPSPEAMPTGSRFLPKPYNPDHVVQHIRELVAVG